VTVVPKSMRFRGSQKHMPKKKPPPKRRGLSYTTTQREAGLREYR
jgi:hypothetical protein